MRINPMYITCDCGHAVMVLNDRGEFTCANPTCANFEKVFRPGEVKVVKTGKSYRETLMPEQSLPKGEQI